MADDDRTHYVGDGCEPAHVIVHHHMDCEVYDGSDCSCKAVD